LLHNPAWILTGTRAHEPHASVSFTARSAPGHFLRAARRTRLMACGRLTGCAILLLWLAVGSSAQAARITERAKTDVIRMKNGDRLTGRIISVQYGILQLSSNGAGGVSIEWPSVEGISSKYMFRV
jgi:hypothetical protein